MRVTKVRILNSEEDNENNNAKNDNESEDENSDYEGDKDDFGDGEIRNKNEDDTSGHEGEANDEIVKLISKIIDHTRYPHCSRIRRKS